MIPYMQMGKSGIVYIVILLSLVGISIFVTYYRYMVKQDFTYFQTEDEIPDQFNQASYSQL